MTDREWGGAGRRPDGRTDRPKSLRGVPAFMVSVVDAVGLVVLIAANTALAAVLTRLFRVRLSTRWGGLLYTLLLTPVVLFVVTLLVGQAVGPDLGGGATVLGVTVLVPLSLGIAVDYFWMPAPDEVEVPDTV